MLPLRAGPRGTGREKTGREGNGRDGKRQEIKGRVRLGDELGKGMIEWVKGFYGILVA